MNIPTPYVIYTGDASTQFEAKTAYGVSEWRPDLCVAHLNTSSLDLGIDKCATLGEAKAKGAKTLLIGHSPFASGIPEDILNIAASALELGLNVASGLHAKLGDVNSLHVLKTLYKADIYDFRHRPQSYPKGTGVRRTGTRVLTVGTDCAVGKKFTSLSLYRAMKDNHDVSFKSTGQTGFLISDSGINNDTIEADFLSGAAEWLSPSADPAHIDIIEGQGALTHPSFCGGSLSLLCGSQPDFIVMCHDPYRTKMRGVEKAPDLLDEVKRNMYMVQTSNPKSRLLAISLFMGDNVEHIDSVRQEIRNLDPMFLGIPIFDPSIPCADFQSAVDTVTQFALLNS